LQSVFANLFTNSIRYRRPGVPLVIEVVSTTDAEGHTVDFVDNGAGVSADDRSRIFEMFERASTTQDGSGIGLALSRRILGVFGASISVVPDVESGAVFRLRFPHLSA